MYGGLTVGSTFATMIFNNGKLIKTALAASLFCNAICLWFFTVSESFYLSVFFRGLIGFFQVFMTIYMPVWSDTFGTEKQKSVWLTISLLASPLGVVLGYTLTYYMIQHLTWEWSFYIQAMALVPCSIAILITPSKYIDL